MLLLYWFSASVHHLDWFPIKTTRSRVYNTSIHLKHAAGLMLKCKSGWKMFSWNFSDRQTFSPISVWSPAGRESISGCNAQAVITLEYLLNKNQSSKDLSLNSKRGDAKLFPSLLILRTLQQNKLNTRSFQRLWRSFFSCFSPICIVGLPKYYVFLQGSIK